MILKIESDGVALNLLNNCFGTSLSTLFCHLKIGVSTSIFNYINCMRSIEKSLINNFYKALAHDLAS